MTRHRTLPSTFRDPPKGRRVPPRPPPRPAPPAPRPTLRVSVIIPYREGGAERERAFAHVRGLYARHYPTWEITTAPGPEGEFSRAGAICDAAAHATGDVIVVADADVWCDTIGEAVAKVADGATWADPAQAHVVRMTEAATLAAYAGRGLCAEGAPQGGHRRVACGGMVALSREALVRCLPDRRFVGWGAEDHAWEAELVRMYGAAARLSAPAPLWHLWHPPGPRAVSAENRRLLEEHLGKAPPARPRVVILADVRTWAWARKAKALHHHLAGRFDMEILYSSEPSAGPIIAARQYDLLHTFEVNQAAGLPPGIHFVTGITAHVWPTWEKRYGEGIVRNWTSRARGVHANSILLQEEMERLLGGSVWYVPNGVDEQFFRRLRPRRPQRLTVGFVGKDNPRKGFDLIEAACKRAGVDLVPVRRQSQNALSAQAMLDYYQDLHVLAVASDMDGTPNPALEAAACECAVVSNAIGNMPEFLEHGVNGVLVERTVESLAGALRDLAARPLTEVEEMGRAARRTIEQAWTWRQMAENYAAMWTACISGVRAR